MMHIEIDGRVYQVRTEIYNINHRPAILLYTTGRWPEPWGPVTVNIPGYMLSGDEIIVKDVDEHTTWAAKAALKLGYEATGEFAKSGFCNYPVYRKVREAELVDRPTLPVPDEEEE